MYARLTKFDQCVIYAAFVAGVGGVVIHLAGTVAEHAVESAAPHLAQWANSAPSRAEQRQIEVASIVERKLETASVEAFIPDPPPLPPLSVLAAQMDRAEGTADIKRVKRGRRARPPVVASASSRGRSAADVFGRNFGVLLMASR